MRRSWTDQQEAECTHFGAALTIATMPALRASGNRSQASMTAAKSESSGSRRVAFWVAVRGRIEPDSFGY